MESYFTTMPKVERAHKESEELGERFNRLITGFSFVLSQDDKTFSISAHRGFLTRGQSIPFGLRWLIHWWLGENAPSIIINDWLFEYMVISCNEKILTISVKDRLALLKHTLALEDITPRKQKVLWSLFKLASLIPGNNIAPLNIYKRHLEDYTFIRQD